MTFSTVDQAIGEMARNIGHEYPDHAWLLSDYDVWTRNPHYSGPPQPHPEDDQALYEEGDQDLYAIDDEYDYY